MGHPVPSLARLGWPPLSKDSLQITSPLVKSLFYYVTSEIVTSVILRAVLVLPYTVSMLKTQATIRFRELNTTLVDVVVNGYKTSSPFFLIHRPYVGYGSWSTAGWKLTHIPSGSSCGRAIEGKNALVILRILAAVLAAMPMDWSDSDPKDFSAIPAEIQDWAKGVTL